jgi:dolichol-phosphate hexosyltransferase
VDLPVEREILVVDDGSTDGTRDFLAEHLVHIDGVRVVLHGSNAGKGSAVRTGARFAQGRWIVVQDADLEYDPEDIPRLLEPVLSGTADVVYGSRFLGSSRWARPWQRLANVGLSRLTSLLYGGSISDMETCYKLIPRDLFMTLDLVAERFDFEPEVTAKLLRSGARVAEVPISYTARTRADGKKIGWRDGVDAVRALWRLRSWSPPAHVAATELISPRQQTT